MRLTLLYVLIPIMLLFTQAPVQGEFFFQDTDHQLEVIRIKGDKPGLTVLIFGGIHGDEPGGYFSSEKLQKVKLLKGNLIVVPRVNFPSIMLNRREVHGDMNRKFILGEKVGDPDAEVVRLLKNLMKEADIFINQHDAFGFHRETYISKRYNPSRYGQSLIIDNADFFSKRLQKKVNLAEIGKRILKRVNSQIEDEDHHFGFWDHNSVSRSTQFPEMRKSATYFALTTHSIPAFGLETSKDLPSLHHKVKYQLLVIKEILHEFDLEAVFPNDDITKPELYWVEFLKNGRDIIRVNGNTNLRLDPGDKLVLKNIHANYDSGLSADIQNWGKINDMEREYRFEKNAVITIKKNHLTMGKIYLRNYSSNSLKAIQIVVDGKLHAIPNWGTVSVTPESKFTVRGASPAFPGLRFDVRGFKAPAGRRNDAHMDIDCAQLIKKYSFNEKGKIYFVKIYNNNQFAGGFQVEIAN